MYCRFNYLFKMKLAIVILAAFGLFACTAVETEQAVPEGEGQPQETTLPIPVATDTLAPTPTATAIPGRVVLLAPPEADPALSATIEPILADLAGQAGLDFEVRSVLDVADFDPGLRLVATLPPSVDLAAMSAANPSVQFLALGEGTDLQPSQNLTLIAPQGERPDQQGFLAGYLAAVITSDWRIGVISPVDTTAGLAVQNGYMNGMVFYCGLCRPAYPPFYEYPLLAGAAASAGEAEWQAAADALIANAVETVFVPAGVGGEALLRYLAQAELKIIGGIEPPVDIQMQWVATITMDWEGMIREVWPDLINGVGGRSIPARLQLAHRNETLFSVGRQQFIERMMDDLAAGFVDSGVDPATGEKR